MYANCIFVSIALHGDHHVRLAYSCATLEEIDIGIRVLGQVMHRARLGEQ